MCGRMHDVPRLSQHVSHCVCGSLHLHLITSAIGDLHLRIRSKQQRKPHGMSGLVQTSHPVFSSPYPGPHLLSTPLGACAGCITTHCHEITISPSIKTPDQYRRSPLSISSRGKNTREAVTVISLYLPFLSRKKS